MTSILPYLPVLFVLLACSGFFSGSEAAFFSLTPLQKRQLREKGGTGAIAARLLDDSSRLLMGILFWNLAINLGYFSLASLIAIKASQATASEAVGIACSIGSLVLIVAAGEFLPKSIALAFPTVVARTAALPLSLMLRLVDVVLPPIEFVTEVSRRIIWPGFQAEPYLELSDLDRVFQLSSVEAELADSEAQVLRNIVQLNELRVEEWMRPRSEYRTFRPPIRLSDLGEQPTPTGYILVTDNDGNEIESYVRLSDLLRGADDINKLLNPVLVIPWCSTLADALQMMHEQGRRVAVVVNEYGETVGVITQEDILEAILQTLQSPSQPELSKAGVISEEPGVWLATGITKLRRLERVLGRPIQAGGNLTIGGAIQAQLHRLPEVGDRIEIDGLDIEVIQAGTRGQIMVRIKAIDSEAPEHQEASS